jgi:2-oxo-4-hydroxy-4-carboxy-5-ureidoimidazoline decarboxylase
VKGLDRINEVDGETLTATLLACCDVPAWADALMAERPYADDESLFAVADAAAQWFSLAEVDRALAAHPRIGERAQGASPEAGWSRQEQSSVTRDEQTQQALLAGNRAYEERFGRVFLICATGLTGDQILAALRERLAHDHVTEAAVVADELRKIALLRLRKVIES